MNEKPDYGSTTAVNKYAPGLAWIPRVVRDKLSPAAVGSAITALAIGIGYVVSAQHDLKNAQRDIRQLHDTVGDLQRQSDSLHKIETQLAVVISKMDDIGTEVDRQRARWDRVEGIAEAPPHANRRRR